MPDIAPLNPLLENVLENHTEVAAKAIQYVHATAYARPQVVDRAHAALVDAVATYDDSIEKMVKWRSAEYERERRELQTSQRALTSVAS